MYFNYKQILLLKKILDQKIASKNYTKLSSEIECNFCKTMNFILLTQLNQPEIRQLILNKIKQILCFNNKIPKIMDYICENTIKSYIPLIVTKLLQLLDNQQLCYVIF